MVREQSHELQAACEGRGGGNWRETPGGHEVLASVTWMDVVSQLWRQGPREGSVSLGCLRGGRSQAARQGCEVPPCGEWSLGFSPTGTGSLLDRGVVWEYFGLPWLREEGRAIKGIMGMFRDWLWKRTTLQGLDARGFLPYSYLHFIEHSRIVVLFSACGSRALEMWLGN